MRRLSLVCSILLITIVLGLPLAVSAAPQQGLAVGQVTRINVAELRVNVDNVLVKQKLSPAVRQGLGTNLVALPQDVQITVAGLLDPSLAEKSGRPELATPIVKRDLIVSRLNPAIIEAILSPRVDEAFPAGGGSGGMVCALHGGNFSNQCEVLLDGAAAPNTYYWAQNIILFRMPATPVLGHSYAVSVRNTASGRTSGTLSFKAVAPRGWRGVHGLRFPNFSEATIPWDVYRFTFGQTNVEFADGTHRPSAQSWYNSTFKSVGDGGNCFGMTQLSLRLRERLLGIDPGALSRVMHSGWIASNVTWGVWTLPWHNNSKYAVEGLQSTQLVEPMASHIATQRASQDNKTAWTYAENLTNAQSRPVHNTLYGHAVATFDTEIIGDSRRFNFYDNNSPYTETEVGGPNTTNGTTNWNTGSFSYGGYTKTRCYDPHALTGQPLLPAGVGGDGATEGNLADNVPARFEVPRVEGLLIRDEADRGGVDGAGIPGLLEVIPDMGIRPVPPTFPRIFLLTSAEGRSITFTLPNETRQTRIFTCFSRGGIVKLTANGPSIRAGFTQLTRRNAQVTLPEPQSAGLQELEFLAPMSLTEERSMMLNNLSGLGRTSFAASLSDDRNGVEVINAAGAQPILFRLEMQRFQPGGGRSLLGVSQSVQGGQLQQLAPANWGALQGGQIRATPLPLPAGRLQLRLQQ